LEAVWKKEYSLEAFTSKDQFKTYEELEKRLNLVLGVGQRPITRPSVDSEEFEPVAPPATRQPVSVGAPSPVKKEAVVDDDDALSYFASLANDD